MFKDGNDEHMEPLANERDLIASARQGDKQAVSTLYEGYAQAVFRYISYRVDTDTVAEDLTAEVFLRMLRGLPDYKDTGNPFGAWLFRIAATQVADHHRGKKRNIEPLSDEQPSDDTDPDGKAAKNMERAQLRQALSTLPDAEQSLLILRFMQGLSHEEVAAVLGKSVANIRVMQHRALKSLATALGSDSKARSYFRGDA